MTEGRLADAIALLRAPGTERELRSEMQFRRLYQSATLSWPVPRSRGNRLSVVVGVASVASVFATATGLSAASVLPSPAAHVVNSVLGPLEYRRRLFDDTSRHGDATVRVRRNPDFPDRGVGRRRCS